MKSNSSSTSGFNLVLYNLFIFQNVIGVVIGKTDVRSFPDRKSTVPLNSFSFIFSNGVIWQR